MRILYKVKHRYVIRSKFGNEFLTVLPKLVLEVSALQSKKIYFHILSYFLAFVVVVII